MTAILKKELRSYFHGILGWLFMAALLLFMGLYFTYYNMNGGSPYAAYSISSVLFFVLLLIPILTMKIWAEERKQKTEQLLFSMPVSVGKIILGKYLAIELILLAVTLIYSLYMVIPGMYGTVPYLENAIAIFAFFLFTSACIAIGFFLSALTENQVVAAVFTYVVLMGCAFMPSITGLFSSTGNRFTRLLNDTFDVTTFLNTMLNGVFDLRSILYYGSIIVIMLLLTYFAIRHKRMNQMTNWKRSLLFIGKIALVIVVCVAANLLAGLLPDTMTRFDVTQEQMYTVTEETRQELADLDEDVTVYVYVAKENADNAITTLLGRYEALSDYIQVEFKDPNEFPNFTSFYTDEDVTAGSMIVVGSKRSYVIPYDDCYETSYAMDYESGSYYQNTTGFDAEGQLTSAINYVMSDEVPVVYVLEGHEEYELPEALTSEIAKLNIELGTINLVQLDAVPEDAEAVILCAPLVDYAEDDIAKLRIYLNTGGHALLFVGFGTDSISNYEGLFEEYGIHVTDGVVFEEDDTYYKEYGYYLLPEVTGEDITSELYENSRLPLLAQCRGLTIAADYEEDIISITPLLNSSDTSYSKVNVTTSETMDYEEGDIAGPFYLGLHVEKMNEEADPAQLYIYGTEYIVDESLNAYSSDVNYTLVLNSLEALVDHESGVIIPVKNYEISAIVMSTGVTNTVGIIVMVIVPVLLLGTGIVIWLLRRRQHDR